jgi:hypothetical protein
MGRLVEALRITGHFTATRLVNWPSENYPKYTRIAWWRWSFVALVIFCSNIVCTGQKKP